MDELLDGEIKLWVVIGDGCVVGLLKERNNAWMKLWVDEWVGGWMSE